MAVFVLVHGAWHGGWCWAKTQDALHKMGHETHAPTLTGLGERSHLLSADISSDLHVQDILNVIHWRELDQIILVGHSYGGTIITGVASAIPERILALVYLDAFVPERSNEAIFANANPKRMAAFQKQIDAGAIALEPDEASSSWVCDPVQKQWVLSLCTPHPVGSLNTGVTLSGREAEVANRHYILAGKNSPSPFQAEYERLHKRDGWTSDIIDTWHDAMVEAPEVLARKLDAHAISLTRTKTSETAH